MITTENVNPNNAMFVKSKIKISFWKINLYKKNIILEKAVIINSMNVFNEYEVFTINDRFLILSSIYTIILFDIIKKCIIRVITTNPSIHQA